MTAPPFEVPSTFLEMLREEIVAAEDAAMANELVGQPGLAEWWRSRAQDLTQYLLAVAPDPEGEILNPATRGKSR